MLRPFQYQPGAVSEGVELLSLLLPWCFLFSIYMTPAAVLIRKLENVVTNGTDRSLGPFQYQPGAKYPVRYGVSEWLEH